jgi:RecA-family ATPase
MSACFPFDEIRAAALAQADRLLRSWFPHGKLTGREFRVGNLQGDVGESLSVNVDTGEWGDFATGDKRGGDLIGLRAQQRYGGDRVAAARELGRMLGIHTPEPNDQRPNGQHTPQTWRPMVPPPEGTPRPSESMLAGFDVVYEYTDVADRLLHYVGRIEGRNGARKKFFPIVFGALDGKCGWHRKHPATPRPLYGLNRLATMPDATVLVCEGEKSADAAQVLFPEYACVSWQGGTASVDYADMLPLQKRNVIIWPDNDEPGLKAAAKLQRLLPHARMLRVADMPDRGDAADLVVDDPNAWLCEHLLVPAGKSAGNHTLPIVNPVSLEGQPIPEREWIVQDWLPIGAVTSNYGDGGTGKTLLAQQLQTACATGAPWCGLAVMRCRSLGCYCEDDLAELHRRQAKINQHLGIGFGDLADMRWVSGVGRDNVLITFTADGRMQETQLLGEIEAAIAEFDPRLVALDTAADLFGGNENDRSQVRRFLSVLGGMAQGRAVLLNAHPSRAGMNTGSLDGGSTAWNNSVRSRWSLTRPQGDDETQPDNNERVLTKRKANYAGIGDTIRLHWVNGVLAPIIEQTGIVGSLSRRAVEETFMALLERCTSQGQRLSDSRNSGNFAPKVFAKRPDREGHNARDFEAAMNALFVGKRIAMHVYDRRGCRCIVAAPPSAGSA